ncbi:MAG: ion transporter [Chloroflexi bacterium]|nr:ion transporter [Chloroflexota bacterium]
MMDSMNRRAVIFEWLALLAIVAAVSVTTFDTDIPHIWEAKWGPDNGWVDDVAYIAVIFFAFEYVVRVWTAPDKRKYIFSFFGIIDLVAVVVGIAALPQFTSLRLFRLLQLVRLLKLVRFSETLADLGKAFSMMRDEIVLFFSLTGMIVFLAAFGAYHFEHETQPEEFSHMGDALWWAVATLTTVGYGDIYPVTIGGKIMTAVVVICGLGIVAAPAGIVAQAMATALREKRERQAVEEPDS